MMLWKRFEWIIYLFVSTAYCCTTSTNEYIRLQENVELYFKAVTVNAENPTLPVSNLIFSPYDSQMLAVAYKDGKKVYISDCFNCTFTGDTATGNLTIRLNNVQRSSAGTYKHAVDKRDMVHDCISVFILGVPSKPKITTNKDPSVRDNVTLTCSSTSTTTPNTHALRLVYNWRFDGTDNPSDSRYSYSTNKNTLTLLNVVKADTSKRFTCTAKEEVKNGYTSVSSDSFSLNVLYGPDNLTFSPSEIYYEKEENRNLDPVTCKAECNPNCTFTWKKLDKGTVTDVRSSAVLNLEMLTSTDAGIYQCEAVRQGTFYMMKKNLTVVVIYGPKQMKLMPATEVYRKNENSSLRNITCSSDCYVCEYNWTGPNSFSSQVPVLSLGRLSRKMAGNYSCTARNTKASQHTQKTKGIKVEVIYGPDNVTISTQSALVVVEGQLVPNITCSSHCYPGCRYSWKNVSDNSSSSSDNVLSLGTVDRYKNGSYRCTAINQDSNYLHWAENILNVIVKYAPDVSITLSRNNITEGASLTLFCNGSGVPSDYNYVSFSQEWNSTKINNNNREVDGTEMYSSIHFNQLQLQDSGTYTCSLNNGVESISGILNQVSRRTLQVKVLPKVLADNMRFTGVTRGKAEIKVPVYSYPDLQDVKVTRYDGTEVESNDKYNKSMHDSVVMTNFYDTPVSLNGSEIEIIILNLEEDDFGNYSLNLTNSLGFTSVLLFVIAEVGPDLVSFIPEDSNYTVDEDTNLRDIQCSAVCFPDCTYTWTKEGQFETVSKTDTLSLGKIQRSDAGNYTCTAFNGDNPSKFMKRSVSINVRVSEQHQTDGQRMRQTSEKTALIVGLVLGALCCILIIYATYVTILKNRLLKKVSSLLDRSGNESRYANLTFASNVTEREGYDGNTESDQEASVQQYTDLSRYANTDTYTYDVINKI